MIKAIIFDKDGTLIDSFGVWVERDSLLCTEMVGTYWPGYSSNHQALVADRLLAHIGIVDNKVVAGALMAHANEKQLLNGLYQGFCDCLAGDGLRAPVAEQFISELRHAMAAIIANHAVAFKPCLGAHSLIVQAKQAGLGIGLATSDSRTHTIAQLEEQSWRDYFDFVVCGDDGFDPKPSPQMFLHCSKLLGLEPHELVMIGDSTVDLHMARAAGAGLCIAVRSPSADAHHLSDADLYVNSLEELNLELCLGLTGQRV